MKIMKLISLCFIIIIASTSVCKGNNSIVSRTVESTTRAGNSYGDLEDGQLVATGDVKEITYTCATMLGSLDAKALLGKDFKVYFLISSKLKTEDDLVYSNTRQGDSTRFEVKDISNGKIQRKRTSLDPNSTYYYRACVNVGKQYYYGKVKSFTTNDITKDISCSLKKVEDITPYSAKISFEQNTDPIAYKELRLNYGRLYFVFSYDKNFNSYAFSINITDKDNTIEISNLKEKTQYFYRFCYTIDRNCYYGAEIGNFTTLSHDGSVEKGNAIDLGLSVKWSDRNIGALSQECTGSFFAWGETEIKGNYNIDNYKWKDYHDFQLKDNGVIDENSTLTSMYDAASTNWGNDWSMPSKDQVRELLDKCTIESCKIKNVNGLKFTGPNGNSIVIPCLNNSDDVVGTYDGYYWSASYSLPVIDLNSITLNYGTLYMGLPIRPVYENRSGKTIAVDNITLSVKEKTLYENDSFIITATVSPSNATNKNIVWSSNNENVAVVSSEGKVTAKGVGQATITAKAADGSGVYATCKINVQASESGDPEGPHINGHEYVDLGLPSGTLWATCNVGAGSPEEYGNRYAWGETETKNEYSWDTYLCLENECGTNKDPLKNIDNIAGTDYDVAHVKWGSTWVIPTKEQIEELSNSSNTTTEWTTVNGINGQKITSCTNGNSIFLPATGYKDISGAGEFGVTGNYWSSSSNNSNCKNAHYLYSGSTYIGRMGSSRDCGFSVRPVSAKTNSGETSIKQNIATHIDSQPISLEGKPILGKPSGIYIQNGKKKIMK